MDKVEVTSTSPHSAVVSDIVVREGHQVRLIFRPEIVDNPSNPAARVRGRFLYQRKGKRDSWVDFDRQPLSSLKKGEQFQLEIKAGELLPLLKDLGALYRIHRDQGVRHGRVEFVKVSEHFAEVLRMGDRELQDFLTANRGDAVSTLRRVLRWLSEGPSVAQHFADDSAALPELNALVGLANLRSVVGIWEANSSNPAEEFWQDVFARHAFVLSQVFSYPIIVLRGKAYVGGKRLDNAHGNLVDFLAHVPGSGEAVLIEIKTPMTDLLGAMYRQDVFPPSAALSGALSQVLHYRESLMHSLRSLNDEASPRLLGAEPRCVVIAGSVERELADQARRRSFERFRERLLGVTVLGFDEVFARVRNLVRLLETADRGVAPIQGLALARRAVAPRVADS
jgi:hypothetical protein